MSFAPTQFPVPLPQGQLAFSGAQIKAHYAAPIAAGNFGALVRTQIIDYVWIVGPMPTLFFAHVAIARAQRPGRWREFALWMATIAPPIAAADALENAVSFAMLARPADFPDWLAVIYSSFAAIKWTWSVVGMTILAIEPIALFVARQRG